MLRIGLGYDSHRLQSGTTGLYLGGVRVSSTLSALAHSDGDVLLHALLDACLSPLGAPDIGQLFPNTDSRFFGTNSRDFFEKAYNDYLQNVDIFSVDSLVIIDEIKLAPFKEEIKNNMAGLLKISSEKIGFKAKSSEGVFPQLVSAQVVLLLQKKG